MENQTPDPAAGGPRWRRNPVWDYDETVLLLDLYRRAGRAAPSHPAVRALSEALRLRALRSNRPIAETYRNPQGVSMKLKAMAQQDPAYRKTGARGLRSVAIDARVWADLAGDPAGIEARVRSILSEPEANSQPTPESRSSHGPGPAFGRFEADRADGETWLYLLKLEGPLEAIFDRPRPDGAIVAKIGRANDVTRRCAELGAGFPPGLRVSWRLLTSRVFATAVDAHRAERRLLDEADARAWALGGEFVLAPQDALIAAVEGGSVG